MGVLRVPKKGTLGNFESRVFLPTKKREGAKMYETEKMRLELEASKLSIKLLELKNREILDEKRRLRNRFTALEAENRRLNAAVASFRTP
jgi:hypothetical protein